MQINSCGFPNKETNKLVVLLRFFKQSIPYASLCTFFLTLGVMPASAGTMTLTTYYPAPNGNYSQVTLYPQTQPSGVCRSGAMYVDNTTGAVGYCVDNNIKPTDGTLIGGTLAGTGSWGKFQASTPVNFNDVANKGYVDAATAGVIYEGMTAGFYRGDCGGANGLGSCNAACQSNYAGSHMCTQGEILRSGAKSLPGSAWVAADSLTQTSPYVDSGGNTVINYCACGITNCFCSTSGFSSGFSSVTCNSWTASFASNYGTFVSPNFYINQGNCGLPAHIHCCK